MSNRKVYVIIILVFLTILRQPISCISSSNLGIPFNKFVDKCEQRCIDQVRVKFDRKSKHLINLAIKNWEQLAVGIEKSNRNRKMFLIKWNRFEYTAK